MIGFETARLRVRRLGPDDIDALHAVYGDAEAMRWVGDGQPLDRDACARWIAVTDHNYATRGYGMAAAVDRDTGVVVGFCGIVHPGGQPEPEIKYALRRDAWGRGLATELVRGLLAWANDTLASSRIIATVDPENEASRRVLWRAGLTCTGRRANEDGSFTDLFEWHRR